MNINNIDDSAAAGAQVLGHCLRQERRCLEVAPHQFIPVFFGDTPDGRWVETGGIIHKAVQTAAPFDDRIDEPRQASRVQKVGLKSRRRVCSNRVQRAGKFFSIVGRPTIMNRYARAVLVQACHNSRANSTGGACDENDLVIDSLLGHENIHKDFIAHMQYGQPSSLPQPDELSAEHSVRVRDHIRDRIRDAGGQISFAEFMHEALYAPGLGYYAAGATKFGADGDFITAPEVSSLFGRILARQAAEVLCDIENGEILECGAGSGKLAVDILTTLEAQNALPAAYNILEVSADLVSKQQARLRDALPQLFDRVRWLSSLPEDFDGVVIANEVLDALPVERFVQREAGLRQLHVSRDGDKFVWTEGDAPARLREAVAEIEADLGRALGDSYVSDVSLAAPSWIRDLGESVRHGAVFLFDYGVSRREYYAADRADGWLRCHFRHHAHNDPLVYPGIQDLTAWVDFSSVAGAAVASELEILGYQTQSQFLLGGGLDKEMENFVKLPMEQQVELSGQIKTLTLPGEMGENFKCMALGRGVENAPSAFQFADRTQTL